MSSSSAAGSTNTARYVDRLISRANRGSVSQADVDKAQAHFEAARRANDAKDYQSACTSFERAYLLLPKPATLVSTARSSARSSRECVGAAISRERRTQGTAARARERDGDSPSSLPKPPPLPSPKANMYVKMGNASIAAEIYHRLLAESLPQHMHDFIADKLRVIQPSE